MIIHSHRVMVEGIEVPIAGLNDVIGREVRFHT
jgi:hypothetical protein